VLIYSSVLIYSGYPRSPDVSVRFRGVAVGHSAHLNVSACPGKTSWPGCRAAAWLCRPCCCHCIGPPPGIVDRYVQMRNTRRYPDAPAPNTGTRPCIGLHKENRGFCSV